MDKLTLFTVITGLATLVSLSLQLCGIWTQFSKWISRLTVFFLGTTVGLLVNFLLQVEIKVVLPVSIGIKGVIGLTLFSLTGLLVISLISLSVILDDKEKRRMAAQSASGASFFLFILLLKFNTFFPD